MNTPDRRVLSLPDRIYARVIKRGYGWVFTPADLHDMGTPRTVGVALTRLVRRHRIRRLTRGIYDLPVHHTELGRIAHSVEGVARSIARRDGIRIQPSGAYAANLVGLSDQVPMRVEFLTDGRYRRLRIGRQEIVFKHTTARNMASAGKKSGLIIQALRHLGQRFVDGKAKSTLSRQLDSTDRAELLRNRRFAPAWIAAVMLELGLAQDPA
jgi:hypothetical protein